MRSDFVPCVPDGVDAFLFPGGGAVNQNDPEKHRGLRKKGGYKHSKTQLVELRVSEDEILDSELS